VKCQLVGHGALPFRLRGLAAVQAPGRDGLREKERLVDRYSSSNALIGVICPPRIVRTQLLQRAAIANEDE
jgi:hypothetical protein